MNTFYRLFSCAVLTAFLASCGGGGTSAPASTTTLSDEEAAVVSDAVLSALGSAFESSFEAKTSGNVVNFATSTENISITDVPCDDGGTTDITGDVTVETSANNDSASGDFDLTVDYNMCGVQNDDASTTVVLDGSITQEMSFNLTFDETTVGGSFSASIVGSVDVSGEGIEDGTCGIAGDINGDFEDNTITGSITACGVKTTIDESINE